MLENTLLFSRCPPRVPTPGERLDGVLNDLEALAGDRWVDREELAAVAASLRRALISAGLRDRVVYIPALPGWVPGAALRPAVAALRAALLRLGVT